MIKNNYGSFKVILDPPEGFDNKTYYCILYYKTSRGTTAFSEGPILMKREIDLPKVMNLYVKYSNCSDIDQEYKLDEIYKSKYRCAISHAFKIHKDVGNRCLEMPFKYVIYVLMIVTVVSN